MSSLFFNENRLDETMNKVKYTFLYILYNGAVMYLGDEGTILYLKTGVDLSTAIDFSIKVLKPDNTEVEWTPIIDTIDGSRLKYEILDTDIDKAGTYKLQSYVETADGKWLGNTTFFVVKNKFN